MTGGSNGIGREICLELARSGCNVACLDVDLEAAQKLCDELKLLGVKANAYKVIEFHKSHNRTVRHTSICGAFKVIVVVAILLFNRLISPTTNASKM